MKRSGNRELVVDSFAGGGGASLGIQWATGRCPDIAINHDIAAIEMHFANHSRTKHYTEDVFKVSPRKVTKGRAVGLLWASPDCKHFSRAKGSKPVEKKIRSLAWVVVRWALECSPRVIILENVREFEDWGPLTEANMPCPRRKGLTFRRFVGRLRGLGYRVEWKTLDAAAYGAPTHRRRLFLIARNDDLPIVWPELTHGDPRRIAELDLFGNKLKPWRTAAECIDWSIPCPSIFDRKRPLAEATMRRIALGIKRYVLENPKPFLVVCNHGGREFRGQGVDKPLPTLTAARDAHGLVSPLFARIGQTKGNGKYCNGTYEPLTTVTSKAEHILVAPLLERQFGNSAGASANEPLPTTTAGGGDKTALVSAWIVKHFGGMVGVKADSPLPTTTARGTQNQLAAATLVHMNHGEKQWSGADEPMRTVTTGGHAALVYAFLTKYFGTAIGQDLADPLHTVTSKDRFGIVTVTIDGQPYAIVDIGMRMLRPRELARGQGFPDDYVLTGTATSQVARIGNSVCPIMAKVLVEANYVATYAAAI